MSGRSAHVRKKITETKKEEARHQADGYGGGAAVSELPASTSYGYQGHGQYQHELEHVASSDRRPRFHHDARRDSDASGSFGRAESPEETLRRPETIVNRPLDDFAYARARKPQIKAEDMTGITKSGVRSAYDKKSEDIRKGLSKAFGFKGKKGKGAQDNEIGTHHHTGRGGAYNHENNGRGSLGQIYELSGDTTAGPPTLPPPNTQLPPLPSELQVRRWIGTGRPVQRWNKLRKDPELWDPHGDVLIYLCSKEQHPRPDPSLRLSSHIIEATDSRYLISLLREGVMDDDEYSNPDTPALSAVGIPPSYRSPVSPMSPMTPMSPTTETHSAIADGGISYELYFPPPPNATKVDQLRYQLTTRNVFAILCHVSLVGLSLYQALSDLLSRLEDYVPQRQVDNVLTIMSYLGARAIDDVRNDAESAIGLLAWAEDPKVRWEEAWREAFVHAAGLYGTSRGRPLMEATPDFKRISPITRALLERASLEAQLRVQAAEERLAGFAFGDMWPLSVATVAFSGGGPSPAKDAADRLQRFLLDYCRSAFGGRWPPPPPSTSTPHDPPSPHAADDEPIWLTRTVAQALQRDFGALYDYLVNRDIVWDMSEARPSRKWLMVSESGNRAFDADSPELPMQDILIEFDNRMRFPHVPHPYPLVPESIPPAATSPGHASSIGSPRRVQLAYTEATNIYLLGSEFTSSPLIDAFVRFEKTDHIASVDPSLARRARWVLLYGILQTLASVSVDAPGVRYKEGVPYHLSPQLRGARLPPWSKKPAGGGSSKYSQAVSSTTQMEEASHELSHCWVAPATWTASNTSASDEDGGVGGGDDDFKLPPPPFEEDEDDAAGVIADHHRRMLGGFPYPPPLSARSRTTDTGSEASGSGIGTGRGDGNGSGWLHSASSQSTTRATTPATTMSPVVAPPGGGFSLFPAAAQLQQQFAASQHHGGGLSRKTSQRSHKTESSASRKTELSHAGRARMADGDGEWAPVMGGVGGLRRQVSMSVASDRTGGGAALSDSGTSVMMARSPVVPQQGQGGRRHRRRKNVGEMLGMEEGYGGGEESGGGGGGGASPPDRFADFDEFGGRGRMDRGVGGTERTGAEDVVAHIIRDFDELGVDDIMP